MVGHALGAAPAAGPSTCIRSGLTRLGRGEFGVRLDLDQDDESRRAGRVLQHGERAAVGESLADGRPGCLARVGGRTARRCRRHREPVGRPAVREPRAQGADADGGDRRARCAISCPRITRLQKLVEQTLASRQPRGPDVGSLRGRRRRARERLIQTPPGERCERRSSSA